MNYIKWGVFGFFMLHILFAFNTGYENRDNQIIYSRKKIAIKYLKGWFVFDVIVSMPWYEMFNSDPIIHKYKSMFYMLKLLRVVNVLEINDALNYVAEEVFKSHLMQFGIRLFEVVGIIFCVAHAGVMTTARGDADRTACKLMLQQLHFQMLTPICSYTPPAPPTLR